MSCAAPPTTSTTRSVAARSSEVRDELLAQLHETRQHLNQLMLDAIQMAQQVMDSGETRAGRAT